jgi:hypothetical protein
MIVRHEHAEQIGSEVDFVMSAAGTQTHALTVEGATNLPAPSAPEYIAVLANAQRWPVWWVSHHARWHGPVAGTWAINAAGWPLPQFFMRPLFIVPATPTIDPTLLLRQSVSWRGSGIRFKDTMHLLVRREGSSADWPGNAGRGAHRSGCAHPAMNRAFSRQTFFRMHSPQQRVNLPRTDCIVDRVQSQSLAMPQFRKSAPLLPRSTATVRQAQSAQLGDTLHPLVSAFAAHSKSAAQRRESPRSGLQRLLQKPPPLFFHVRYLPRHMPWMCYPCDGRMCYLCDGTIPPCLLWHRRLKIEDRRSKPEGSEIDDLKILDSRSRRKIWTTRESSLRC